MPIEINDIEDFIKLSQKSEDCRIKRLGDIVKLKLKTSGRLYTLKLEKGKAEGIIKRLKCKTVEI